MSTGHRKPSRTGPGPTAPAPLPGALGAKLEQAAARHQAGDLAAAEAMYREIAARAAGHPDVHHLLGLALHQQGRDVAARTEIEAAIRAFDRAPHYHNNLGEVLRAGGELELAIAAYRRALALAPQYLQAINNLGLALHAAGRFGEARDAFEQVVAADPGAAQAHNNLGIARQSLGDLAGAIASFRRATELAPDQPQGWNNLGAALHGADDLEAAEQALQRAVAIDPRAARAHYNLSRVCSARGDGEQALRSAHAALALDPAEVEFHLQLGYALRAAGRFDDSVAALRGALERAPRHPIAHNDLGVSLLMSGSFEQAERHLLAAVEAAPGLAVAYENLARARRFGPGDAVLMQRLEKLLDDPRTGSDDRVHLHFALGKMWDDREEWARAFAHFEAANRGVRAHMPWDADARSDFVDRVIASAPVGAARPVPVGAPAPDEGAPVFIVGMPRSGTTLVEQILASHSRVVARGELEFFTNLSRVMPQRLGLQDARYPECVGRLGAEDLGGIARSYVAQGMRDAGRATRFTDKNPLNFDHLGVIAAAFPESLIVHVRRDALDTALSVYTTHFQRDNAFAYDLEDIGRFQRDYQRLMAHWREVLGERLYEIDYEQLVADQERATRALIDACGLEWEPGCLDFHRTRRVVGTASHWQVRQPLYSRAVGRAQGYAPWLGPLERTLER